MKNILKNNIDLNNYVFLQNKNVYFITKIFQYRFCKLMGTRILIFSKLSALRYPTR